MKSTKFKEHHSQSWSKISRALSAYSLANLNRSKLSYETAFSKALEASICISILLKEMSLLGFGRTSCLKTDFFIYSWMTGGGGGGGIDSF